MKPRFTTGEWVAYLDGERLKDIDNPKDYLTKKQEKDGIDTPIEYIESADNKMVIGYDYKIVRDSELDDYWTIEQWPQIVLENKHDVRLIELAPLLAQHVMSRYHKDDGEWFAINCMPIDKETIYLLDELAKLYEEDGRKCDDCNGGGYIQIAVDGVDCCSKCEGIGFLYEEGES